MPEERARPPAGDWGRRMPPLTGAIRPVVEYGPDVPSEAELRLLGAVEGRRVLDLGCGSGLNAIALALQGAHVIAVDPEAGELRRARDACAAAGVAVELHLGDLADLAFVRADSVEVTLSTYALGYEADLGRLFRQVHRVLRPRGTFVISLTHPAFALLDPDHPSDPLTVRRSYFDRAPVAGWDTGPATGHHHTLSDLFTGLTRSNFRVDLMAEPPAPAEGMRSPWWREASLWLPHTLVLRARKEGG